MSGREEWINEDGSSDVSPLRRATRGLSNQELMQSARAVLAGNWGSAVFGYLLFSLFLTSILIFFSSLVFFLRSAPPFGGFNLQAISSHVERTLRVVLWLISAAALVGQNSFALGIVQEHISSWERLFDGFGRIVRSALAVFFVRLFIGLWSLLLVIPGIIATYRYAMVFFILADDPVCGPLEALGRSKVMMRGEKWKFVCLQLRFLGWDVLSILTLGLGFIWVFPYRQITFAQFYENLK